MTPRAEHSAARPSFKSERAPDRLSVAQDRGGCAAEAEAYDCQGQKG